MRQACIYLIFNVVNGHHYIGSTVDIDNRFGQHVSDLNCKRHHSIYLQRAWFKYGRYAFVFLKLIDVTERTMKIIEGFFIKTFPCQYNMMREVQVGGGHRRQLSYEHRLKLSAAQKGKRKSEEHKRKIGEGNRGKIVSEETRLLMSIKRKGKKQSPEFIERRMVKLRGRKRSAEYCEKMRQIMIRIWKQRKGE